MTNGYCSITIGDKPVGIKFAFLAIKLFTEASVGKLDIYFIENNLSVFGIAKLIESGYKNNCELKEQKYEISFEEFCNWVEQQNETEEGQKELGRILEIYSDSTYSKKFVEKIDEKKSQIAEMIQ